ncbi:four-carbon acid sugar kinase family protein [Saccharomonospora azurea]
MTPQVAVIADDLTGAGDTALQFTEAGWTSELLLHTGTSTAEVVAVTTDSRALDPAEAAQRVRDATAEFLGAGVPRLYKKIDSTVRGPVRAEIDAVLDALGPEVIAVVCPAFPAVGRTLVDGTLLVDGTPVADTSVGRDPVTPVTCSHVPTLLDAPLLRLAPERHPDEWAREARATGSRVVGGGAPPHHDLDRVAALTAALGDHAVAVGSAGLAAPLARHWREPAGTALVVVTTLHSATAEQAARLRASGVPTLAPTSRQVLDDAAWAEFTGTALATAAQRPEVLLLQAPERGDGSLRADVVSARLGALTAQLVREREIAGLVATGGDGARAVLSALGGTGIRVTGHVAPGVPLGTVVGGPNAGLPVATKAGGFGGPDVLTEAAHAVGTTRQRPRNDKE